MGALVPWDEHWRIRSEVEGRIHRFYTGDKLTSRQLISGKNLKRYRKRKPKCILYKVTTHHKVVQMPALLAVANLSHFVVKKKT